MPQKASKSRRWSIHQLDSPKEIKVETKREKVEGEVKIRSQGVNYRLPEDFPLPKKKPKSIKNVYLEIAQFLSPAEQQKLGMERSPRRKGTSESELNEKPTLETFLLSNQDLTYHQLPIAVSWMLEEVGILKVIPGLSSEELVQFVNVIQFNYNEPPFHNFSHAFCVTQMVP
jgi:hypothetical protein